MSVRMVDRDGRSTSSAANLVPATAGYFQALGIRLLRGRWFEEADDIGSEPVAVISERAARELTFEADPIGRQLSFAVPTATGPPVKPRVIGVVADVRYLGLDTSAVANVYVRWRQLPVGTSYLVVRVAGDASSMIPVVARTVREVDPTIPLLEARTLDEEMNAAIAGRRLRLWLVADFAVVASAVAFIGLFAMLGRDVTMRRRELAVRAAMGASPRDLAAVVARDGGRLTISGLAIGLAAALAAARWLGSLIYGITPYDPATYALVTLLVVCAAALASYVPARRATRLNPAEIMHTE